MFWKKKAPSGSGGETIAAVAVPTERTVIDSSYTLKGRVHGQGPVEVQGRLEGHLDIHGQVSIGRAATVQGEIKAEELEIGGQVRGQLEISRRLLLDATARFEGSAAAGRIEMAEGACLNGDVQMKA
jgi:cytoskeletal protein CcmA (bactofilin family)